MIYLDSAATTMIAPEVLEAMMPYLTKEYGNAGTLYKLGRSAAAAIQNARTQVAVLFNCTPEHVMFTSGGSEGNSTVFSGLRKKLLAEGKNHLVVSAIEHDSVLKAAESLTREGFQVTYVQPDSRGFIPVKSIEGAIHQETGLVSVMFVNNESGAINDIATIGGICRQNNILFHADCVQAAGQYQIDVNKCNLDFATVSSHKIHGPKGIGALYARESSFVPLICGGAEQEFGLRGGTENVAGIVGFGKACVLASRDIKGDLTQVSTIKQKFYMTLIDELKVLGADNGCIHVNGISPVEPSKILNIRADGVDGETLLLMLDANDICVSAGSACRSHEAQPSHVLTAMGLSSEDARSSIRV